MASAWRAAEALEAEAREADALQARRRSRGGLNARRAQFVSQHKAALRLLMEETHIDAAMSAGEAPLMAG